MTDLRQLIVPVGVLALVVACDARPGASQPTAARATTTRTSDFEPAGPPAVAVGEGEAATCVSGTSAPVACRLLFSGGGEATTLTATAKDGGEHVFKGRRQDGWWSGTLNGAPAMAYELNRGHVVFASTDLGARWEYWTAGNEHGSY